ncbi:hypothetical protein SADUNF_Sadunf08G0135400 [Salix dunnii]|uniref:Isopenicillin N synthase-like Fe(2+) 2OG dioxygenase domain-containing protein n=1 Tax=Salix dunnii TaxID=1413687 RepID=A0A835MY47_9ROSI|nr:hypothetical protein SADUNF_Sadunf08G0135400 [Salix dunnii]
MSLASFNLFLVTFDLVIHQIKFNIRTTDLKGILGDSNSRGEIIDACKKWGFFRVINDGILMNEMLTGIRRFHEQETLKLKNNSTEAILHRKCFLSPYLICLSQLISNDKLISVEHRVLVKKVGPRISASCFLGPEIHSENTSEVYGTIKELLSEENHPVYRETNVEE